MHRTLRVRDQGAPLPDSAEFAQKVNELTDSRTLRSRQFQWSLARPSHASELVPPAESRDNESWKPAFVHRRRCPHLPKPAVDGDPVKERVLALVAEKTGYPVDMLDLDLDLEADLGIDTVKQAEVMATIREAYGIVRDDTIKLRDFPTLARVIQFVHDRKPDLRSPQPVPIPRSRRRQRHG